MEALQLELITDAVHRVDQLLIACDRIMKATRKKHPQVTAGTKRWPIPTTTFEEA